VGNVEPGKDVVGKVVVGKVGSEVVGYVLANGEVGNAEKEE